MAALVLPGFGRGSVTVVSREEVASVDPQSLVTQAIDRYGQAPDGGLPIWHGRFETLWYFDNETIAPLHAELWLDRDIPARHRIQLSHAGGGAPYELQLGDGRDRLYYALNAGYAQAIYAA
ncbi:MAG: hypothetical protein HC822_09445 [Oscillochloris sp.]|nr:hypothetical protein [Oscillochloris sp.]